MNISSNQLRTENTQIKVEIKNLYTKKLTNDETKALRQKIVDNANTFTFSMTSVQSGIVSNDEKQQKAYEEFQTFFKDIAYKGKPIAKLSQEEAKKLVVEDGFFGITQTSQRIADFVINGAQGDVSLLRAGREGIIEGFKAAEKMWGKALPDISKNTTERAIQLVDKAIISYNSQILDTQV